MTRATYSDKVVLAAILGLALILRVIGLNQPLWYDELITLYTHIHLPWSQMMTDYEMNHHYLYSFQAKGISALLGESAWAVRVPALLFGVASIWAVWILVRDIASTRYAHITAALLALSYHHIWFSQNARGYTELMFWCSLGFILFLRGLETPRRSTWLWFGAVLALSVFTHLTGFFFFFAMGVVWLVRALLGRLQGKPNASFWLPALGFAFGGLLCVILYLPVLAGVLENAATVGDTSAVDEMKEYQNPIWTVLEAIRTIASGLGPLTALVAIAVIGLTLIGAMKAGAKSPLFPFVVFAHILFTMALLYSLGMRIWPRFFFVDIGFLLALIVLGVSWVSALLGRFLFSERVIFNLGVLGMLVISAGLAYQNYRAPKQNIPGPMALIEAEADQTDAVYAVGYVGDIYVEHIGTGWGLIKTRQEMSNAMANPARKWLVIGFPTRSFRSISGLETAVEDFDLVESFPGTLGDGAMLVYRQKMK